MKMSVLLDIMLCRLVEINLSVETAASFFKVET
jgi:hypothetical protein